MRLSIIVPVYKAEKYLNKCIDSILTQPFKDWELILIDDGSPDSSGKICDEYAESDGRIKVFHKQNEGVSIARNKGLDIATGDYVTFVDSDDYLEGDCFGLIQNSVSDFVVFESISYKSDGTLKYWYDIDERKIVSSDGLIEFIRNYINVFVLDGPCGKFLKRSVIGDCRFPEGQPLGEDNVFMLSFISICKSVELKKGAYYVIDDHYTNGFEKYYMSAEKSLICLENIFNSYERLGISVPSFEQRMFGIFFMAIDPKADYSSWYENQLVKKLENNYLLLETKSFRLYYYSGKNCVAKHICRFLLECYNVIIKTIKIRSIMSNSL